MTQQVDPIKLTGKYGNATVFASQLQEDAQNLIISYLDNQTSAGQNIAIMCDVHYANTTVVGFTSTYTDKIVPNLIGGDIGCGVLCLLLQNFDKESLPDVDALLKQFQSELANINEDDLIKKSLDFKQQYEQSNLNFADYLKLKKLIQASKTQFGTLGSGNHFLEIATFNNNFYLLIHSGSRSLGMQVHQYYQLRTKSYEQASLQQIFESEEYIVPKCQFQEFKKYLITRLKSENRSDQIQKELQRIVITEETDQFGYLESASLSQYLSSLQITQEIASLNRWSFALRLQNILKIDSVVCESVHNYVDIEQQIIRKGAQKAQMCIIPINMKIGSLLVQIEACEERNYSAPHGAGRLKMRKLRPSLEQFLTEVQGIYSSTLGPMNSDEAPSMYKSMEEVRKWAGISEEIATLQSIFSYKE